MFPFDMWHRQRTRPAQGSLFAEALIVTLVSITMAWVVFPAASGLISVFLVSIGMQQSFAVLLEVNRRDIYDGRLTPYAANARIVSALVVVFVGCFVAFSLVAWSIPTSGLRTLFSTQLELSPLNALDLNHLSMGTVSYLVVRNLWVFGLCLVASLVFREGGAMLILAWNASVWALSYTFLSRTTVVLGTAPLDRTLVAVVGGITPHLVLEASAYTTAALVGIFAAKAIEKYHWRSPEFRRVARAVLLMIVVGGALLLIGALAESAWPTTWFAWIL